MANRITTVLDLDGTRFGRGIKQTIEQIKSANGAVAKLKAGWEGVIATFAASPAAIGAAAASVGLFAKKAIDDASNLAESINAVNVAYGESAEAVHQLGKQSVESFGLSRRAFNEFAVQFSAFADQIGRRTGQDPAKVLQDITTRVADFASVNNLQLSEAARVVQSALAGETEAFRRYGGDVSAATTQQYALNEGLAATAGAMTETDKIVARFGLIMQQTEKDAGDFKNTQDGLANSTRSLSGNLEDLSASFGSLLIPVVADAASTINNLITSYDALKAKAGEALPGGDDGGWLGKYVKLVTGGPVGQAKEGLNQLQRGSEALANALTSDSAPAFDNVADSMERHRRQGELIIARHKEIVAETGRVNSAFEIYAENIQNATKAAEDQAQAEQDAADALKDKNKAIRDAVDAYDDYERAQLDVGDAQDRLTQAQADLNRLLTEGKVSADEKARADKSVTDAQSDQADAASNLAEAQADLRKVIASAIPTNEEVAASVRKVEDAQRDLEDAIRGVGRAQRELRDRDKRLADLRKQLAELDQPEVSDKVKQTAAYKEAQREADLAKKRTDLIEQIDDAELDLQDAQQGVRDAQRDVEDATLRLNDAQAEHNRLMTVGKDVADQKKAALERVKTAEEDLRDATDDTAEAVRNRDDLYTSSVATDAEIEAARRDVKQAELDLRDAIKEQATALAEQQGAAEDSTTALALMRGEIERIIALSPQLAEIGGPLANILGGGPGGAPFSTSPFVVGGGAVPTTTNYVSIYPQTMPTPAELQDLLRQYDRLNGPR